MADADFSSTLAELTKLAEELGDAAQAEIDRSKISVYEHGYEVIAAALPYTMDDPVKALQAIEKVVASVEAFRKGVES